MPRWRCGGFCPASDDLVDGIVLPCVPRPLVPPRARARARAQRLQERSRIAVIETCLMMTMFREEFSFQSAPRGRLR